MKSKKSKKTLAVILSLTMMVWLIGAAGAGTAATVKDSSQTSVTSDLSMEPEVTDYVKAVKDNNMDYFKDVANTLAYDTKYQDNGLGWRTAGSDAEQACAGYLQSKMTSLGLTQVEKSKVTVDKFQFNSASFKMAGTAIDLNTEGKDANKTDAIASYQVSGTSAAGINAPVVDCGTGFEADYAGKNVKGKIVLVGVNQADEAWIDGYMRQAKEKGAAAMITYSVGGYGSVSNDSANVQDVCCADLHMPTTAVSYNNGMKIKAAIKAGHQNATLKVDTEFAPKQGTSYNVIGKIKGSGNTGQQILVASHYDKYWYGYQDDSTGIATVLSIAKAMTDSNYKPYNDIVFVCHGAEEWGATNTQFDWSNGSWHNITEKHPSWSGKTLAMFNFELTAVGNDAKEVSVSAVPEYRSFTKNFVDKSGLAVKADGAGKIVSKSIDTNTMEDGISYRWAGVPYFCNAFDGTDFMTSHYHTQFDNQSTYTQSIAQTNLNLYGAMAIYTDSTPALELDLTGTCDDLKAAYHKKTIKKSGVKTKKYRDAYHSLRKAAVKYNAKIKSINTRYEEAVKDGASEDTLNEYRAEGTALNKTTLKAFKYIQQNMMSVDTWGIHLDSEGVYSNVLVLSKTVKAMSNKKYSSKKKVSKALDQIYNLNGVVDYNYYIFSKKVGKAELRQYDPKVNKTNTYWCTDRLVPVYYVGNTTYKLVNSKPTKKNVKSALKVYKKARKTAYKDYKKYVNHDISGMKNLKKIIAY
ncbi:MAG: M28 family peptidase [Eubacteriaceae bacterium]|nr:M28 family peptidase [Eubacteriaceae bacterium]